MLNMLEKADYCCSMVAGRIRPGIPQAQARSELEVLSRRFSAEHSRDANGILLTGTAALSRPGQKGENKAGFALMFAAVFLILLLACANVGNLLIARSAARRREIATRLSIGASRPRIIRQLLTESLVLGAAAGTVGLAIAYVLPPFVMARVIDEPMNFQLRPDRIVLAFSLGLSVIASVLFGLAPALHATRVSVTALLKEQASGSRLRLRSLLLGVQIALSVVLLVAAGLMMRGVQSAAHRDPGFSGRQYQRDLVRPARQLVQYAREFARCSHNCEMPWRRLRIVTRTGSRGPPPSPTHTGSPAFVSLRKSAIG